MPTAGFATLLQIDEISFREGAARGLTQTIEPIEAAKNLRRTINGTLVDLSVAQFRRYRSTISCSDQEAPELHDIWPGKLVTVTCLPDMIGPGSVEGDDPLVLSMRVASYKTTRDEWGAVLSWSLELEQA